MPSSIHQPPGDHSVSSAEMQGGGTVGIVSNDVLGDIQSQDGLWDAAIYSDARSGLEAEGCPACYPENIDTDDASRMAPYRDIVNYFSTGEEPLKVQLLGWLSFRRHQAAIRRRYTDGDNSAGDGQPFSVYVDMVRARLGHDVEVHLCHDVSKQSQLDNWVEFQAYEVQRIDNLARQHADLMAQVQDSNPQDKERKRQNGECIRRMVFIHDQMVKSNTFLAWMEEQRLIMESMSDWESVEDWELVSDSGSVSGLDWESVSGSSG